MFNRLLSKNRVFMALVLAVVFAASGLLYLNTVKRQATLDFQRTQERVNAPKPPPPGETAQSGHWHGDVWHAEPHEAHTPVEVSEPSPLPGETDPQQVSPPPTPDFSDAYQALREKYPDQTQNPPPFENVPVNLWDFEATKKVFMDHFNFYVEHYDPKEGWSHTRELRIAAAIMENIHNAADPWVGLFTPEQRKEINAMHQRYFDFKGVKVNHKRVWELVHDEGYSVSEALRISREEDSNR
ncbi:MAG: hypothetical protein OXN25_21215 [Candidatus Poribacteria bacterium]|nr:hypothetical protein [Candidatus Poribacteria bacterium]